MGMSQHKYDETLEILTNMAKVKLAMNNHKGNIEDLPYAELSKCLEGEVAELNEAMLDKTYMAVIEEGADVLNFLLAAVHKATMAYRTRKDKIESNNK